MNECNFDGFIVRPKSFEIDTATMVGILVMKPISSQQHAELMRLNENCWSGRIGVRTGRTGTSVMFLNRMTSRRAIYKRSLALAKAVSAITGAKLTKVEPLASYKEVRLALTV